MTLTELAASVANYRNDYAKVKAELDASYQAWLAETQPLGDAVNELKDALADAERRLREAALAQYEATGTKKLPHGVGVKVTTKLEYDPADALEWAHQHKHTELIVPEAINAKEFEKIAKVHADSMFVRKFVGITEQGEAHFNSVPVVKLVEVPTATLPTDTAKLLAD